jgi:hypothetical protein
MGGRPEVGVQTSEHRGRAAAAEWNRDEPLDEGGTVASDAVSKKAGTYLRKLCVDIPSRRVGSRGNRAATDFFAETVAAFGFETESQVFDCIDWVPQGAQLSADGVPFQVRVSPYSLGCCVRAPLVAISTAEELEDAEVSDRIVLLRGDIAREQLMPKNFPFYNPDEHKRIIQLCGSFNYWRRRSHTPSYPPLHGTPRWRGPSIHSRSSKTVISTFHPFT